MPKAYHFTTHPICLQACSSFFTDERLNQSPIICFTETQTGVNVHIPFPNFASDSHMIVCHDSSDKFTSLLKITFSTFIVKHLMGLCL